jgi:hypothetical protein
MLSTARSQLALTAGIGTKGNGPLLDFTVTVTCLLVVPPQPVPVSVYVVVVVGLTVRELAPEPTSPRPGSIVVDPTKGPVLPFVILPQLRVTDWPEVIEVELALKYGITGAPAQPEPEDPEDPEDSEDPEDCVGAGGRPGVGG